MNVHSDDAGNIVRVVMPRPSNFHGHLRTGALRRAIARDTLRPWKHFLAMPNTGPITTIEEVLRYHEEIRMLRDALGLRAELIMTLYLTGKTTPAMIEEMARLDFPCAVKYYPPVKGATTGSGHGLPLDKVHEVLSAMEANNVRLLGHFETVHDRGGNELPMEEREDYFMIHEFLWLREKYPSLSITIEHATTKRAIEHVRADGSGRTTCTITPQAMILVREDLNRLTWGNHAKCMPIAKTPEDRAAVSTFAVSGDARAYLGDDTAPHPSKSKLVPFEDAACGCYTPHSLALYARQFVEENGRLDNRFIAFACLNGPDAWGLPQPAEDDRIILYRTDADIPQPSPIEEEGDVVIPFGWTEGDDAHHPGLAIA